MAFACERSSGSSPQDPPIRKTSERPDSDHVSSFFENVMESRFVPVSSRAMMNESFGCPFMSDSASRVRVLCASGFAEP